MLLTNLLMQIPGMSYLYLWWRRHQTAAAVLTPLVANPTHKQRQHQCLWCWKEKHPHGVYPPHLTSSMCVMHSNRERAKLESLRAERRQEVAA